MEQLLAVFVVVVVVCLALFLFKSLLSQETGRDAQSTFTVSSAVTSASDSTAASLPAGEVSSSSVLPASEAAAALSAQGSLYGLDITVEQVSDTVYAIHISNDTESTFNLGWVGGPLVTVTTDAGAFSSDIPAHMGIVLESGDTYDYQLELPGASGTPQTVSIDKCYILGERGLPENMTNSTLSMQFA